MKKLNFLKIIKEKKGVAGLEIFLSVIAMIFVIGIIVMAFQLTGAKLMQTSSAFDRSGSVVVVNESQYLNGTLGYLDLSVSAYKSVLCSVGQIYNGSTLLGSGNYSSNGCRVSNSTSTYSNFNWKVNYNYTYLTPNDVSRTINETKIAVGESTSWFGIFITIAAVVVLILLIVLIIVSLRGAGLMGGGNQGGA